MNIPKEKLKKYKVFSEIPYNKIFNITDGITGIKIEDNNEGTTSFRVMMAPNCKFPSQTHNCDERFIVYKGSCKDEETGITINRGEYYYVPANKPHTITSLEKETILYVEFKKPIK